MSTDEPEQITIDIADAGARLTGTSKGSPASEAVRTAGRPWTWGRRTGCWVLPRSLRPETIQYQIWRITAALEAIGCTVEVVGGDDVESEEERQARRLERDRQLVDVQVSEDPAAVIARFTDAAQAGTETDTLPSEA